MVFAKTFFEACFTFLMLLGKCTKYFHPCSSVCGSGESVCHTVTASDFRVYTLETFRVSRLRAVEFLSLPSDPWVQLEGSTS